MVPKLLGRGALAGALAGLVAFVFARIFAEPQIQKAIDYESARDKAQDALDKAAGAHVHAEGHDIFSRTIQADVGLGVGLVLFGAAMGLVVAVVCCLYLGRVGRLQPRPLALLVAAGGFMAVYLVPFLRYPANPPAIGHEDTIHARGMLYLTMVVASIAVTLVAVRVGQALAPRLGSWNAAVVAGLGFVVVIGVVMLLLPDLGHLAANKREYGNFATETPQPLKDAQGTIVFPGFPADVLATFRLYSVVAQIILWGGIGLVFAPLAEKVLRPVMGDHESAKTPSLV